MLCSFHYAADAAMTRQVEMGRVGAKDQKVLALWAGGWRRWVSVAFLKGYVETLGPSPLLPAADEVLQSLLEIHVLQQFIAELGDHLENRPALLRPACEGILQLLA